MQLKEVRREVELSRRRSIKLKAQVDKLQESHEGQGWSQHRERVWQLDKVRFCTALPEYYTFFPFASTPGHRGSSVHSATAEPPHRARVRPTWTLSGGKKAGCCLGPAAECGPQAGNQPHYAGKGNPRPQIKLFPLIMSLQSLVWVYFSGLVIW